MAGDPDIIPKSVTPQELAAHIGASPRGVADKVRDLGCYRKIGAKVFMLHEDVETFMKAARPCRSNSTNVEKSGTTGARLPEGDFEKAQALLTKKSRNASRQKQNHKRGEAISMAQGRT